MRMSNNTALITGGTSGIGRALAQELLRLGNTVVITGRDPGRLKAACQALPGVHGYICDQTDPKAIAQLYDQVVGEFPSLNVLINNAGVGLKRDLTSSSTTLDSLASEILTNLVGPVQLVTQFMPQLRRQPSAAIMNVTSGLAFVPLAAKPVYCATKSAMHAYTLSLRAQLHPTNVRVFELAPPATATAFNDGQDDMNIRGAMSADAVAKAAISGMRRDRLEILPGAALILKTIGRIAPRTVLRRAMPNSTIEPVDM